MTVKELVNELLGRDPEAQVYVADDDNELRIIDEVRYGRDVTIGLGQVEEE